jgi:hypothetical protein
MPRPESRAVGVQCCDEEASWLLLCVGCSRSWRDSAVIEQALYLWKRGDVVGNSEDSGTG